MPTARLRSCRQCGEPFTASHPSATYCTGRCRMAAHRARRDDARDALLTELAPMLTAATSGTSAADRAAAASLAARLGEPDVEGVFSNDAILLTRQAALLLAAVESD